MNDKRFTQDHSSPVMCSAGQQERGDIHLFITERTHGCLERVLGLFTSFLFLGFHKAE